MDFQLQFITPTYDEVEKFNKYYRLILPHDNYKPNFPYCEEIFTKLLELNSKKYSFQQLNEMMYNMFYSTTSKILYIITPETHEHIKNMLFKCYCNCQYCVNRNNWSTNKYSDLFIYLNSKNEKIKHMCNVFVREHTKIINLDSNSEIDLTNYNETAAIIVNNINLIKDCKGFDNYNGLIIVESTQDIDKYKNKFIRYNHPKDEFSWLLPYERDFRYFTNRDEIEEISDSLVYDTNGKDIAYMYDCFDYIKQFDNFRDAKYGLLEYREFRTIVEYEGELMGWIYDEYDLNENEDELNEYELDIINNFPEDITYEQFKDFGCWVYITRSLRELRNYFNIDTNTNTNYIPSNTLDERMKHHLNYIPKLKIFKTFPLEIQKEVIDFGNLNENNKNDKNNKDDKDFEIIDRKFMNEIFNNENNSNLNKNIDKNKNKNNKLDCYSLLIISKYFNSSNAFINLTKTCSEYNQIIPSTSINPFPLKTEQDFKIFNSINTYNIYSDEHLKILPLYNKYIINYKNPFDIDNDDLFYLLFYDNSKFQFKFNSD